MLDQAEPSFDDEAGVLDLGAPLLWWRRHEPATISMYRYDLLAELATATRGLIEDALINSALGGNASIAAHIAERLSGRGTEDLPASWVCWAAACDDALAICWLTDRLANESRHQRGKARDELLALVVAWHRKNPAVPFSTQHIRRSFTAIDDQLRRSAEGMAPPDGAQSASVGRPIGPSLKVMAAIGDAEIGEGKRLSQHYRALTAPLALRGGTANLEVLRVVLLREFPWMWDLIEELFEELHLRRAAGVPWLHFSPRLLVGPPGIGKTRFARRMAQLAGTGYREINAGGSSDNRLLMGTARGWESAQPALPLMTMRSTGTANPVIVVDEIDKTRADGRNGDIRDTLLAFLEDETARAWFDECLLAECDLSQVSWMLTANTVDRLPSPLRSRLLVVRVDRPQPIHFEAILRSVIGDFARELGITAAELPELGAEAQRQLRARFEQTASVRDLKSSVRRTLAKSAALLEPVLH